MWKPPECTVAGGFLLLTGWVAVSCGWVTTLLVLGAAALHELGHILCLRRFGAPIRRLRIGVLGAVLETGGTMSYGRELAAVLAGPLANLLAAVLLGWLGYPVSAGANAVLGAFNLLPVSPLDGGRALYLLLVWLAGPETAEWGCRCVGLSTALAAASGTVWLMWRTGGSIWLLPAAAGLLTAAWKTLRHGGTG